MASLKKHETFTVFFMSKCFYCKTLSCKEVLWKSSILKRSMESRDIAFFHTSLHQAAHQAGGMIVPCLTDIHHLVVLSSPLMTIYVITLIEVLFT